MPFPHFTAVTLAALAWPLVFGSRPQHAGSGEGALSVWEIKARIADEIHCGRHRLRATTNRNRAIDRTNTNDYSIRDSA